MFVATLLLILSVGLIKIAISKQNRHANDLSTIPGPPTTFGIGNILQIGTTPKDFLPSFARLMNQYGDVIKVWIGPFKAVIFVKDLDVIKEVLSSQKNINKTTTYNILKNFLGNGLVTSQGSTWKLHRKTIEPAFSHQVFDSFVSIFNRKLDILMDIINKHGPDRPVNLDKLIHLYSLDAICEATMGIDMDCQKQESDYRTALETLLHIFTVRAFSPFKRFDFVYQFTSDSKRFKQSFNIMNKLTMKVIEESRKAKRSPGAHIEGKRIRKSLVDILLSDDMQTTFTDRDIEDQVNTFLVAGHETVSSAIYLTLYEIAKNPDIQKRIYDETKSLVGSSDDAININQLHDMKYLDLVFKEGLRKYPSVPMFERVLEDDTKVGEYFFPEGTGINVQIYNLHNDARYFPNPEKFDPDRFLNKITPFSYIPFSKGPRNCIGKRYASLIFKTVISKLVFSYSIEIPEGFEPQVVVKGTLCSVNGLPVYFKKR